MENELGIPDATHRDHYWKVFDQRRWGFTSWATTQFVGALQGQLQPTLDLLDQRGIVPEPPVPEQPMKQAMEQVWRRVGGAYARSVFSNMEQKQQVDDDEQSFEAALLAFVHRVLPTRIRSITVTTRGKIKQVVNQALVEGWSVGRAKEQLQKSGIVSDARARLIARTEIISASNKGSLIGAKGANMRQKEWLDSDDSRVRRAHAEADHQTVPIDEPFSVDGFDMMFPGDPTAPPQLVINCRCTMVYPQ